MVAKPDPVKAPWTGKPGNSSWGNKPKWEPKPTWNDKRPAPVPVEAEARASGRFEKRPVPNVVCVSGGVGVESSSSCSVVMGGVNVEATLRSLVEQLHSRSTPERMYFPEHAAMRSSTRTAPDPKVIVPRRYDGLGQKTRQVAWTTDYFEGGDNYMVVYGDREGPELLGVPHAILQRMYNNSSPWKDYISSFWGCARRIYREAHLSKPVPAQVATPETGSSCTPSPHTARQAAVKSAAPTRKPVSSR